MPSNERGLKNGRFGVKAGLIGAAGLLFLIIDPVSRSFAGLKYLIFILIGDLYCLVFILWQVRRPKNRSGQGGTPK
jgi:hypothetical protein